MKTNGDHRSDTENEADDGSKKQSGQNDRNARVIGEKDGKKTRKVKVDMKKDDPRDLTAILRPHRRDAVSLLLTAMKSTITYVNKRGDVFTRPDWKHRIEAAQVVLAYGEGQPVKRSINANVQAESVEDLELRMRQSPSLARSMKKVIEMAEGAMLTQSDDKNEPKAIPDENLSHSANELNDVSATKCPKTIEIEPAQANSQSGDVGLDDLDNLSVKK